ncbi:hypothetical protein DdX_10774 [Ditylenchus destructor]|uniref:Uncharacterized protein n=1 Tax=Ditylenchus destructor TaxID=166010 RepID=A0AAD4N073_9BILA|nr:hypothetical protein DdX_10774 [Ditylenchus destructor]
MDIYSIGLNTSYGWISVEFGGALDFEECITYVTDHRDEYAVVTKCQHVLLILFVTPQAFRCMITYMSFTAVGMLFSVCRGLSFLALGMADGGMIDFRLGFCIPYVDTLPEITQCLNSAICGLIYNKVLSARKDKVTTLTSSTTGNANNLSLAVPQATLNVANKSANVTHVTAINTSEVGPLRGPHFARKRLACISSASRTAISMPSAVVRE